MSWFTFHFQDVAFSFLGLLFEACPFLLLGSILSGIIDAFVSPETIARFLPKNSAAAIFVSGLLGGIFPMCECGSVIVVRRFIRKGLPVSCAVTYMLGSPIVNPLVALSTYAAFRGESPGVMMSLRLILGFLIAVAVGFLVRQTPPEMILQPAILNSLPGKQRSGFRITPAPEEAPLGQLLEGGGRIRTRIFTAIQAATSDFMDVAFYLVIGAAIASIFNTAVNQAVIAPLATSPAMATCSMMILRFLLGLCSTSDAFIAASFRAFPFFAKLAFLVFGAMFDIKLFFLYGLLFRRWFIFSLGIGLFIVVGLACIRLAVLNP